MTPMNYMGDWRGIIITLKVPSLQPDSVSQSHHFLVSGPQSHCSHQIAFGLIRCFHHPGVQNP